MLDRHYRRRLDADLLRWQADGAITADTGDAIRRALGPMQAGVSIATMVGIAAGLLIAAAFLAFVAANWSAVPRVARFGMLLAGIGHLIESAHNQGKVSIVAAVTPAGRAAIKRLLIDGKPVYDEPIF